MPLIFGNTGITRVIYKKPSAGITRDLEALRYAKDQVVRTVWQPLTIEFSGPTNYRADARSNDSGFSRYFSIGTASGFGSKGYGGYYSSWTAFASGGVTRLEPNALRWAAKPDEIDDSDYECRMTHTGSTGGGGAVTGTFGSWLSLDGSHTWGYPDVSWSVSSSRTFSLEIRRKGSGNAGIHSTTIRLTNQMD